jgi:hypothetical protein
MVMTNWAGKYIRLVITNCEKKVLAVLKKQGYHDLAEQEREEIDHGD